MKTEDAKAFRELLFSVFSLYGKDLSEAVLSIWWGAMRPFDLDAVKDALTRHAVNPDGGQYLPKPADVVRLIDGGGADSAALAWVKFEQGLMRFAPYWSVVFDDPLIHCVVQDMGGWTSFCEQDASEWPFIRNQFIALYRAHKLRTGKVEYPRTLIGIAEMHNAPKGYKIEAPILVGDLGRARTVYEGGSSGHFLPAKRLDEFVKLLPEKIAPS